MDSSEINQLFATGTASSAAAADPHEAEVERPRRERRDLLEGLNPPQREAVLHTGSPVLVVAGALKVTNLESSVLAVRGYQLLPYEVALVVGYMLPLLEIIVGLLLIAGLLTRFAGAIGACAGRSVYSIRC